MFTVNRNQYEELLKLSKIQINNENRIIDVYHSNNWNQFVIRWDEEGKNDTISYIDFFFDAKDMVDFLGKWIKTIDFQVAYIASFYCDKYKLKKIDNDICRDIYDELKKLFNSLSLKVNTNKAIAMKKDELIRWLSRISIGGFTNVSEYSILIPDCGLLIKPHHHMNYLIYTNEIDRLMFDLNKYLVNRVKIAY